MTTALPEDASRPSLTRAAVVEAAFRLIDEAGLDGLSMRPLATRLGVRPASLYWHVRDRRELMELLASALLERAATPAPGGWRTRATTACASLASVVEDQRDASRILLEVPDAIEQSPLHGSLAGAFTGAGLDSGSARDAATMLLTHVVVRPSHQGREAGPAGGPAELKRMAIEAGSKGILIRAGESMQSDIRVAHDPLAPPPGVVRGDTISVRRLRGGRSGELEVNPAYPWTFHVQSGVYKSVLDLRGIDVRGIHIDSGAYKLECILSEPHGVVPIAVSSGVYGFTMRRPAGVAMVADVSAGAFKVKLDSKPISMSVADVHWETPGGAGSPDRYELIVASGCARVTADASAEAVESTAPVRAASHNSAPAPSRDAVELLLDGIAAHISG